MPRKPGKGGGPGQSFFDLVLLGPPPGDLTVGQEHWIDLGVIPTGKAIWYGAIMAASPDKAVVFELRTNQLGESAGTEAKTDLLVNVSVRPKSGTVTKDLYRRGRLHITSVVGDGTAKHWLRLESRKATAGAYLYTINYILE